MVRTTAQIDTEVATPAQALQPHAAAGKPDEAAPRAEPAAKRANPARKVAGVILVVLIGTLGWHVATDLVAPASSSGSVTALTALMAPRVSGQVQTVLVQDNQFVVRGTPLFELDPAPFDLAVRQAEANLAQVTQTLDASVISLVATEAKVEQARASLDTARTAAERTTSLHQRGLASQVQLDAANAQLASARSGLDAAIAELESARLRAGGKEANPQVETAAVQLEQARLNRSFASVLAPADGVVTNLKLAQGQDVNAGTPALTFIEADNSWVVVDMRENQLANIDVGDDADILFDGAPGRKYPGVVRGIAWGIDPGRTAANGLPQNQAMARWFEPARTIPVHVELAPDQTWPDNVRVGSKASALVYAQGRSHPVAVAASALQTLSAYFSYLY
ncbi:HlyD family secretion protein [Devosia sp. 1635]|uniref:HlyD family secretion protein n=1 Tax=Devosia sp. 1635 TaxID=2726066 RepID=UPI001AEE083C